MTEDSPSPYRPPGSGLSGVVWPPLPHPLDAMTLALHARLERTQWLAPDVLRQRQMVQALALVRHAAATVPHHAPLAPWARRPFLDTAAWADLPRLTRAHLMDDPQATRSRALPADHGPPFDVQTTGSLGQPVRVRATRVTRLFQRALSLRQHTGHGRDVARTFAAATVFNPGDPPPATWVPARRSGPALRIDVRTPVAEQADWLLAQDAAYFLTYPSNLKALLAETDRRGARPRGLVEVLTFGEALPEGLRGACRDTWGVPLTDHYSATEVGSIAQQCPDHDGAYHLQAENLLVEVLDDDGRPCEPGQAGRVVVTDLHNYAQPLIRYELGDVATVGPPCACGRGLPVVGRVNGRVRNMLRLPGGGALWPSFPGSLFMAVAPIRQVRLVQRSLDRIDVHLAAAPLSADQEAALSRALNGRIGAAFTYRFSYPSRIPAGPGGKYEDFVVDFETPETPP